MSANPTQGIRLAALRRDRAEKARLAATAELRRQVVAAREQGVPITQIAREAGLSRQAVYDLLAQARPS